jgi:hypothetical protein
MKLGNTIRKAALKGVETALTPIPFMPYDRKIPIPGLGSVTLSPRKNSFLGRHRNWLRVGLAAAWVAAPMVADTAMNTYALLSTGQHALQQKGSLQEYYKDTARRVVNSGTFTIGIYDIDSSGNKPMFTAEEIERHFSRALWSLGIETKILYQHVDPQKDWSERLQTLFSPAEQEVPGYKQRESEFPKRLNDLIASTSINENRPDDESHIGPAKGELPLIIANYMMEIIGPEKAFQEYGTDSLGTVQPVDASPDVDISIIIADFKDYSAGGIAIGSDSAFGKFYALMDRTRSGHTPDKNRLLQTAVHEALHKLGIHHASFFPVDGMSYGPISRQLIEKVPQLSVGPETWLRWRDMLGKYKVSTGAEAILPSQDRGLERVLKNFPELDTPLYRTEFKKQFR